MPTFLLTTTDADGFDSDPDFEDSTFEGCSIIEGDRKAVRAAHAQYAANTNVPVHCYELTWVATKAGMLGKPKPKVATRAVGKGDRRAGARRLDDKRKAKLRAVSPTR